MRRAVLEICLGCGVGFIALVGGAEAGGRGPVLAARVADSRQAKPADSRQAKPAGAAAPERSPDSTAGPDRAGATAAGSDAAGPDPAAAAPPVLRVGAASVDITPPAGLPLWGYAVRKDVPAKGTRDPLLAKLAVLEVGDARLAILGLDAGRPPARSTFERIRTGLRERAGIDQLLLGASHTHHGPCLELEKREPTASYLDRLAGALISLGVEAVSRLEPARVVRRSAELGLNRNRHSRRPGAPVDAGLRVLQFVDAEGAGLATLVNFAAHPTNLPATDLRWSADFVGLLRRRVESDLGGVCVFLQGASGDLSCRRGEHDADSFGDEVGRQVVQLLRGHEPRTLRAPRLEFREESFRFSLRIDLEDPRTYLLYCLAFFQPLVDAYRREYAGGVARPRLTIALLGSELDSGREESLAWVGASGEFFAAHALRLRERARLDELYFVGLANGYQQYFPTIEAIAEGGYGADRDVSPVEVGAGERMMDRALIHLWELRGKIDAP